MLAVKRLAFLDWNLANACVKNKEGDGRKGESSNRSILVDIVVGVVGEERFWCEDFRIVNELFMEKMIQMNSLKLMQYHYTKFS